MKLLISKESFLLIALSILFLIIPSSLIAVALSMMYGHFLIFFLGAFASIFVIGQISNIAVHKKAELDIVRIKNQLTAIINQQSVEVSCAYCKDRNLVPIKLNVRNTFECKECKQTNLIIFQFATAQITVPLENPQLGTMPLPKETNEQNTQKTQIA